MRIKEYICNKRRRFVWNTKLGIYNYMTDKKFLEKAFLIHMKRPLNINTPQTFNEKLQWLKLFDRKPEYTDLVDKYAVKRIIAEKLGEEYVIPTLGVWDNFDEIDFENLPDQFVLKCTHDSGGIVICRDKSKFDIRAARRKIKKSLKRNYYWIGREWPYKNVKPRIIAEKYMAFDYNNTNVLNDYKLQCFNGKFDNIFVATGRFSESGVRYYYFDKDWNYVPYSTCVDIENTDLDALKPRCLKEMITLAERLSVDLPQLRVDFYEIDGKVYFGEVTFYSQSGFDTDITYEADYILGKKLILPELRN